MSTGEDSDNLMATNVRHIRPEIRDIHVPAPLRDLPIFLCWRLEPRHENDPKPRKVPYYPLGGRRVGKQGSVEDRSRLTTFAVARDEAAKRGYAGVGIALLDGFDLVAIDVDNCVRDGKLPAEILDALQGTYVEFSPSGRGIRALLHGNLGNRKAPTTDDFYGLETFSTSGFTTLTGAMLPHVDLVGLEDTIGEVSPQLLKLCADRFGSGTSAQKHDIDDPFAGHEPRLGLTPEEIESTLAKLDPGMGRDQWIRVGMAVHHESQGDDTGFELWHDWSSLADNYVSEEDLRKDWDSFERRQGSTGHQVTMRSVLKMVKDLAPVASSEELAASIAEGARLADDTPVVCTPDGYDGKFRIVTPTQLSDRPPPEWFIKGIVPKAEIIAVFGPSGSGKSFNVIDLLGSISRGAEWRGRRTKQARVLIVAAEGSGSFNLRLEAYARTQMLDMADLNIGVIADAPNLMEKDDVSEIVKAIAAAGGVDIVAFDTFAQTTPGANENSGEDMGRALANAKAINRATGAMVVLVLHTGKDLTKGSRGWSGVKAAMDAQIEIIREEDGRREIHLEKMRDGQDGLRFGFELETITMGVDADGDAITSCVVRPTELVEKEREPSTADRLGTKLGPVERLLIETAEEDFRSDSRVGYDTFVAAVMQRMPEASEGMRDTRRQRVVRALTGLSSGKDSIFQLSNGNVLFYMD